MKEIHIGLNATKNKGLVTIVDDEDYEELLKYNWQARWSETGRTFYVSRRASTLSGKSTTMQMQRQIMQTPKGMYTDHINHDTLDNRRSNLRICTPMESMQNRRSAKGGTSKYKGVCWDKRYNKWIALICANRKQTYLGLFKDETEAARAYDKAAKETQGEFAMLNFKEN